jgi:hypothetical protein
VTEFQIQFQAYLALPQLAQFPEIAMAMIRPDGPIRALDATAERPKTAVSAMPGYERKVRIKDIATKAGRAKLDNLLTVQHPTHVSFVLWGSGDPFYAAADNDVWVRLDMRWNDQLHVSGWVPPSDRAAIVPFFARLMLDHTIKVGAAWGGVGVGVGPKQDESVMAPWTVFSRNLPQAIGPAWTLAVGPSAHQALKAITDVARLNPQIHEVVDSDGELLGGIWQLATEVDGPTGQAWDDWRSVLDKLNDTQSE